MRISYVGQETELKKRERAYLINKRLINDIPGRRVVWKKLRQSHKIVRKISVCRFKDTVFHSEQSRGGLFWICHKLVWVVENSQRVIGVLVDIGSRGRGKRGTCVVRPLQSWFIEMRKHSVAAKTSDAEVSGEEEGKKRDEKKKNWVLWFGWVEKGLKKTKKTQNAEKAEKAQKAQKAQKIEKTTTITVAIPTITTTIRTTTTTTIITTTTTATTIKNLNKKPKTKENNNNGHGREAK